jgi:hypothetical protein
MPGKPTEGQDPRPLLALTAPRARAALAFMMRRTISLTALLVALTPALGATARAATPEQIIKDCSTSETSYLTGSYTKAELRRALAQVRGDIAEYTACYDAIRYALGQRPRRRGGGGSDDGAIAGGGDTLGSAGFGAAGGGGPAGGSDPDEEVVEGGPPADVVRPATPQPGSGAPVTVGGEPITPGSIPSISRGANALPGAIVIFLVLLGATAVGGAATTIGRRVLARRRL